jgi:hypothetical protein
VKTSIVNYSNVFIVSLIKSMEQSYFSEADSYAASL